MVVVCDLRHLLFDRVEAVASLVNRTFAVCHDDVFETHRNQQADNGDSGCRGNNFDFIQFLSNQFQRIDDTGQCDHGCSMLIIVENRNITAFL